MFIVFLLNAQVGTPFNKRVEKETKGELILISNNILNKGNQPNNPYNDVDKKAKQNDKLKMKYIDIDSDKSTFSSSSANLHLDNPNAKIIYAAIYWSATYKYEEGKLSGKKFVASDENRHPFDKIKIKFPNTDDYIFIEGKVIFDGHKTRSFDTNAPYAAYADITSQVQSLSNPSGTYTVANIRATQGVLSGGSSAGWTMVFIVEDFSKEFKYFTVYDGFVGVTNKPVNILFTGFQALPQGKVSATISGSVLEGDLNMEGDQLLIKSDSTKKFIPLENNERKSRNFFNSSITLKNQSTLNRVPNSKNTLGYDSFDIEIDNPENSVISNNAKEVTLRLLSYIDRYFMFMTAFEIQVTEPELVAENLVVFEKEITQVEEIVIKTEEIPLKEDIATEINVENQIDLSKNTSIIPAKELTVAGVLPGYYIVANVFSIPSNATKFVASLSAKNIEADFFINPINNYRYVFLSRTNHYQEAVKLYFSYKNGIYKEDLWIMKVNID